MNFLWLASALRQGTNGIKKYREKNVPVLPPYLTPPPQQTSQFRSQKHPRIFIGPPLARRISIFVEKLIKQPSPQQ
jgi:hypothetical protein